MKTPKGFPLTKCANGCDAPPCPPSLVICRACLDRVTAKMQAISDNWPKPAAKVVQKKEG